MFNLISGGRYNTILANELVPGDIVKFATGDRIPADVRLLKVFSLPLLKLSSTNTLADC